MYSQCPECQTVYRLEPSQLEIASGQVRCGHCHTVFDASLQTLEGLPIPVVSEQESLIPEPTIPAARGRSWMGTAAWSLASLVMVVGLLLQAGYAMRSQLAASHTFGPMIDALCDTLHCTPPLPRDPTLIELADYSVTPHPQQADAWRITGALHNAGDFDQHYPRLRVSLPRQDGSLLAARDFEPADYLPHDATHADRLHAEERVEIQLDIVNPGQHRAALRIDIL